MPRKGHISKREKLPDPKYNDMMVQRLINCVMLDGKKSTASGIVYGAINLIEERLKEEGLKVFHKALDNIKPEIEVFDQGMIWNAKRLMKEGYLQAPFHFQCCLQVHGGMEGTPRNLVSLVDDLPAGSTWSAFGCGPTALAITTMAIHMGGHVRVGMEDNVFLHKNELAKHNYEFVERVQRLAQEFRRPVANVAEAREILSLPPKK